MYGLCRCYQKPKLLLICVLFNYTKNDDHDSNWSICSRSDHSFCCPCFVNLRASPNVCLANYVLEYTPLWQPALWLLHKLAWSMSKFPWIPSIADLQLMCHQHLWLHGDLALQWGVSFTCPLPHLPTMMANPSQWPNSKLKTKNKDACLAFFTLYNLRILSLVSYSEVSL